MAESSNREEILEKQYEEAKVRLNQQRETMREFSRESINMVKLVLVSFGGPAALLGILESEELNMTTSILTSKRGAILFIDPAVPTKWVTAVTLVCAMLSIVAHLFAAGFDARGHRNIANPSDVYQTNEFGKEYTDYLENKSAAYMYRIEENDRIINSVENFLIVGKIFLVFSMIGATIIVKLLITGVPLNIIWLIIFTIAIFLSWNYLPGSFKRADKIGEFDPPYSLDYLDYRDEMAKSVKRSQFRPIEDDSNKE